MTTDPSTLKAIDTYWDGLMFRSRLEARWAVFYDHLGIKYEYEKEGYDLGGGIWYLPDFWLPIQNCFVEVKPVWPIPGCLERIKAERLAIASGLPVAIAYGNIGSIDSQDWPNHHLIYCPCDGMTDLVENVSWNQCMRCGQLDVFCGRCNCKLAFNEEADDLLIAYRMARQMRFENKAPDWTTFKDRASGKTYAIKDGMLINEPSSSDRGRSGRERVRG